MQATQVQYRPQIKNMARDNNILIQDSLSCYHEPEVVDLILPCEVVIHNLPVQLITDTFLPYKLNLLKCL